MQERAGPAVASSMGEDNNFVSTECEHAAATFGYRHYRSRCTRLISYQRCHQEGVTMKGFRNLALFGVIAAAASIAGVAQSAQYLQPTNAQRSYGAGVVTEGGRIVWLAGMGGTRGPDGKKVEGIADQTRQAFRNIEAALQRAGGSLENVVSMTVMIRNQADGDEFVKVRGEFFKSKFPASMLITAKDFANPDLLVEIQSVAVIGDTLK